MDGAEPKRVSSVSAELLLEFKNQFCPPLASPKRSVPIVRGESNVTVRSAVMSSVLKSAALPAPEATMPFSHLVGSLQTPSLSAIHVPLAALVCGTCVVKSPTIEQEKDVYEV